MTLFLKVGRCGISVGRYSDYYPNEVRSSRQYGTLYDRTRGPLVSFFLHPRTKASGNTLVYNTVCVITYRRSKGKPVRDLLSRTFQLQARSAFNLGISGDLALAKAKISSTQGLAR